MNIQRKPFQLIWAAAFTSFFGATAFLSVYSNPRFATINVLDVIRLMTAGAGLAVTVMMLVLYFTRDTRSEDK